MYKISVIIPVYNTDEYLRSCMKSLQKQTIGFENLEIIMVDDGSRDNSRNIMKEFEQQYKNVKCIYLDENSGAGGKPRNEGMKTATAEYIMFLDSDDKYYDNACLELFESIQKVGADSVSGYYSIFEKDITLEENALSGKDIEEKMYSVPIDIESIAKFQSHFACKIYKKEVIKNNDIWFPEGIIGQDTVFFWRYLCNIHDIYYLSEPILKYRQRKHENKSVSYILTKKYFQDTLQGLNLIIHYFKMREFADKVKYALKNTNDYFINQLINSELNREDVYSILQEWIKVGSYENVDDAYSKLIMDDIKIGNIGGASNKIILLRELKSYYGEVWDAKVYFENKAAEMQKAKEWAEEQIRNKDSRIEELQNTAIKLNEGKKWLEGQYESIKAENDELRKWCNELETGKEWLENAWKSKCKEFEELKSLLQNK